MSLHKLASTIRMFHADEDGMEAIQGVMIAAIGAVVLAVVIKKWPSIKSWFDSSTDEVTQFKS